MTDITGGETSAGAAPSDRLEPARKRRVWPVLLLVIAAAASGGGYYYYVYARPYERTDDAFIEGSITRVSPQVPGQVVRVHVEDNQPVNAGDLLVEIDPRPYEVRLDTARAALRLAETRVKTARVTVDLTRATTDAGIDQAEAEVDAAKAAVEQAHAEVAAAEAEAKRAETDSQRYDNLDESAVSRQRRDLADATARVASARLMEAHKQVVAGEARVAAALGRLASAKTGPQQVAASESQAEQAVAGVEQAKAAVRGAELDLSYTKVYAPMSGHVTRKSVRVGENVQAGQALFSIVPDDVWIIANFKETQLTRMRPGQPVTIRVDVYPAVAFAGHVDSIQGGTGARFSLLPPENATGNYVKVVQRVPVKILFDAKPGPDLFLAPGMSVVPRVRVR